MEKNGTGLRKKILDKFEHQYKKKYQITVKIIYWFKENKKFGGYNKLDKEYKKIIKKYWKPFGINPGLKEFEFYSARGAKDDPRYITKKVFHSIIEPKYNDILDVNVLSNKNYLDLILKDAITPTTVIRNIKGIFLDANYKVITKKEVLKLIKESDVEYIYKPAVESGGGRNISFVNRNNIDKIINYMDNEKDFVIQKIINQHKVLQEYNKSSVNTFRVLSFLYKGNVNILYMVLRIGKEGMRIDNASAGGIQVLLKKDGSFSDYIIDIDNKKITDEKIIQKFKNLKMPFYEKICEEVKRLHPFISVCGLIGWDITIDEKGNPLVIEINLQDIGMTDISQCLNGPLFGDLTDDILKDICIKKK